MRPDDLGDLRVALLGGELAALHEFADLPRGHIARLVDAGLHELLADVLEHDREPGGGDRLRDLPPHRPRAHHRCLEHEHAGLLVSRSGSLSSLTEKEGPGSPGAHSPQGWVGRLRHPLRSGSLAIGQRIVPPARGLQRADGGYSAE